MDRPLPTDPPDQPVNRINDLLEGKTTKELLAGLLPNASPIKNAPAFATNLPIKNSPSQGGEVGLQKALLQLSKTYEANPHNPIVVLAIATLYLQNGDEANARAYLEWLAQLLPEKPPPSVDSLLKTLKRSLGNQQTI